MLRVNHLLMTARLERGQNSLFGLPSIDKNPKRLYLELEVTFINEVKSSFITALVDTGADVNLINASFLKKLFPDVDINANMEETSLKVQGFSGERVGLIGSIKICARGHKLLSYRELEFLVFDFDSGFPVVLGLHVLEILSLNLVYKLRNNVKQPTLVHQKSKFDGLITSYYRDDL